MKQASVYRIRIFRYNTIVAMCFIGLLLVWLLLKPGTHAVFLAGDMIAQPLSIIVGMIISLSGPAWQIPRTWVSLNKGIRTSHFWMTVVFLLICADELAAQGVTAYMTFA